MKKSAIKNLKLYPHFKLTNEKFPRLLVTRKIENDDAEYFGAFLPKTGARILLGFVNKIFKLRSCEIEIDGKFPFPCPMFYRQRCLAPCVENICDKPEYNERVQLLRLFLADERDELRTILTEKIERFAEKFGFENAAKWRDFLFEIEKVWENKRWQFWQHKAIDTWDFENEDSQIIVNLVTQRGRKILGNRSFLFQQVEGETSEKLIEKLFLHFYKVYVPKEIRIFRDFKNRKSIAKKLSVKFGRKVEISIQKEITPTTKKGLMQTKFDFIIGKISAKKNVKQIQKNIKKEFSLRKIPNRIEAYDVAHISGKNVVAAKIVWENGSFSAAHNEVWHFDEISEPEAVTEAIRQRFAGENNKNLPDLILIDGGKTQINAALEGLRGIAGRNFKVISAVKPHGRHNEVSHFLDENLRRIEIKNADAFHFLTNLRDHSHDLANRSHTNIRDTNQFYELAQLLPHFSENERRFILQKAGSIKNLKNFNLSELNALYEIETSEKIFAEMSREKKRFVTRIIPIKFDADGGNAEDLQPIGDYKII